MMVLLSEDKWVEKEDSLGIMEMYMMANLNLTKCMEMVLWH